MNYNFSTLSPADFEDLVRDLIGRELKIRFEAFRAGPDGGVDGRHAKGTKLTILQVKHYAGSSFSSMKAAMSRERKAIDRIKRKRYILGTSQPLSPKNKAALAQIIGPSLRNEADIFGPNELNALLRAFPDVEKATIKLWLSSAAVLERVVRSATSFFTALSRAEIEAKVRVYAQNVSFAEARDKLEANHVVIISGPPGVGKTTLAEMLSYAYIGEEWEFVAVRSLDDGFASIVDAKKQIFFFDDFLGKVALDARALSTKDSDLARFIKRIRSTSNARFVLTTRAPIFEEARRVSEHLADPQLDIVKYVLDVGIYTRRIRARILYNHLYVAATSRQHIKALWGSGAIKKIIDHPNYNPRLIEAMTDGLHTRDLPPEEYSAAFLSALDNPHRLWDTAFRTHIPAMCRHLLFSLFFCSEYGVDLDDVKLAFSALHPLLCRVYNIPHDAKDFEASVKILEGGFISITGRHVSFINPSVRDYLTDYLDDAELLASFASVAPKVDWAERLWEHVKSTKEFPPERQALVARSFKPAAEAFPRLPVLKQAPNDPTMYRYYDLSPTNRISLVLEWLIASGVEDFARIVLSIARSPVGGFNAWRDGTTLVRLVRDLRNGPFADVSCAAELSECLESGIVSIFEGHIWPDDLDSMWNAIDGARDILNSGVFEAAENAIVRQIEDAMSNAAAIDSESTLEDHAKAIERLAARVHIPQKKVDHAVSLIQARISEINIQTDDAESLGFSGRLPRDKDKFDDVALLNLFAPLLAR